MLKHCAAYLLHMRAWGCQAVRVSHVTAGHAGSTLATLFTVPLSKKRKRDNDQQQQQQQQQQARQAQNGHQKPLPPSHYRVTLQQMEANDYPLPLVDDQGVMTCPKDFVATQPAGETCAAECSFAGFIGPNEQIGTQLEVSRRHCPVFCKVSVTDLLSHHWHIFAKSVYCAMSPVLNVRQLVNQLS